MLRGAFGNPPEHDAGKHGAEKQGEATGETLHSSEVTIGGSICDRVPYVSVTQVLSCLCKKEIPEKGKNKSFKTFLTGVKANQVAIQGIQGTSQKKQIRLKYLVRQPVDQCSNFTTRML